MSPELRLLLGLGLCVTIVSVAMLALRLWTARQRRRYRAPDYRPKGPLARPDGYQRQADLNEWARQQERRGRTKLGLLVALLPLLLLGCGIPADVVAQLQDEQKDWQQVADDQAQPAKAREVGQAASDWVWWTLYRSGDVKEIPADVRARVMAKGAR